MRKYLAAFAVLSLSATASALEYGGERNPFVFRPYVSLTGGQGKLELTQNYNVLEENEEDELEEASYLVLRNRGREAWTGFAIGADFSNYPVELQLSYGNIGAGQSDAVDFVEENLSTGEETLVERYEVSQDYDFNAWSLTGKLDLSWNCQAACAYLLAGYSYGTLDWDFAIDETVEGEFSVHESKTLNKGFAHVGAGVRYDVTDHFRLNAEYVYYNIGVIGEIEAAPGEKVEFNMRNLPVWQAGLAYTF